MGAVHRHPSQFWSVTAEALADDERARLRALTPSQGLAELDRLTRGVIPGENRADDDSELLLARLLRKAHERRFPA